jgi:hypothetical protein
MLPGRPERESVWNLNEYTLTLLKQECGANNGPRNGPDGFEPPTAGGA